MLPPEGLLYAPACSALRPLRPAPPSTTAWSLSPVRSGPERTPQPPPVQHRHLHPYGQAVSTGCSLPAGNQHQARRPKAARHRSHRRPRSRRAIEHQQQPHTPPSQHRVHPGHRIPRLGERRLRRPLAEPGRPGTAGSLRGRPVPAAPPTSPSCRCAYSTATLVLPARPPRTTPPPRGPAPSSPPSRASSAASSSSRPAGTPRGASRTPAPPPPRPAPTPVPLGACPSAWIPVLSPGINPFRSLNSAARTPRAASSRNPSANARPGLILQIRHAHRGDAGAQQRHPRDAALPRPQELQLSNRQAPGLACGGRNPYRCPKSAHTGHTRRHPPGTLRTVSLPGR